MALASACAVFCPIHLTVQYDKLLLIFPKSLILLIVTGCSEVYERIADMYDQTSKF